MPIPLLAAAAIPTIAGGLISGITGLGQKRKARKLMKGLDEPVYSIPDEILRNQRMAELAAQEGMPAQQYSNAMKNIQRNQASLLTGARDRRSALMALPRLQQAASDATANLDAQDAAMRLANLRTLYSVGATTAAYKDKQFSNQMQSYLRKLNYAQQLRGAGNLNFTGGIEKLIGGVGQLAFGGAGMGQRRMATGNITDPTYYNDYGAGSQYAGFETGF